MEQQSLESIFLFDIIIMQCINGSFFNWNNADTKAVVWDILQK